MLHRLEKSKSILDILNKSEFNFYLTGSRFFGNFRPDSDYDFYAADSKELRKFLQSIDFYKIELYNLPTKSLDATGYYHDSNMAIVYRHHNGIDIQLVNSVLKKFRAQKMLKAIYPLWHGVPKEKRFIWWNAMYRILDLKM